MLAASTYCQGTANVLYVVMERGYGTELSVHKKYNQRRMVV